MKLVCYCILANQVLAAEIHLLEKDKRGTKITLKLLCNIYFTQTVCMSEKKISGNTYVQNVHSGNCFVVD